jgi:hypothetical protein
MADFFGGTFALVIIAHGISSPFPANALAAFDETGRWRIETSMFMLRD